MDDRISIKNVSSRQLFEITPNDEWIDLILTSTPYPGQAGFEIKTWDEYKEWFDHHVSFWFDQLKVHGVFVLVYTGYNDEDGQFNLDWLALPKWIRDTYSLYAINAMPWIKTNVGPKGDMARDHHSWELAVALGRTPFYYCDRVRKPYSVKSEQKAASGNYRQTSLNGTQAGGHSDLNPNGAVQPNFIIGAAGDGRIGTPRVSGGSFTPAVAARLIETFCPPRGKVLDPFCGRGTALVEAERLGRYGVGCDISSSAYQIALNYIGLMRRQYAAGEQGTASNHTTASKPMEVSAGK